MTSIARIMLFAVTQVVMPLAALGVGAIIVSVAADKAPGVVIGAALLGAMLFGYNVGAKAPRPIIHADDCGRGQYLKLSRRERYEAGDVPAESVECTCQQ